MKKKRKSAPKEVWSPESEHTYVLRRITRADARNRRTLKAFAKWLAGSRGLSPATITLRMGSASTFVDAVTSRAGCSCAPAFQHPLSVQASRQRESGSRQGS